MGYTVQDPTGYTLKVPVWMTESTATTSRLSPTPFFSIAALREVHTRYREGFIRASCSAAGTGVLHTRSGTQLGRRLSPHS